MARFSGMTEDEKSEIYGQVAELAAEGMTRREIADTLEISTVDVSRICFEQGIKLEIKQKEHRALTRDELKFYKKCRSKNEPILFIAKKMGLSKIFLSNLEKYLKLEIECKFCHTILKNERGLYQRYCPKCNKERINLRCNSSKKRRYQKDPVFRAKMIKDVLDRLKRKRLT